MKNKVIIGIVIVALLAIGGFVMSQNTSTGDKEASKDTATMTDNDQRSDSMEKVAMEKDGPKMDDKMETDETDSSAMMMAKGTYTPYTEEVYESASDTDRVLFFYASWCPTCQPIDTELENNMSQIPEGVTVFRVNYEDPDTDTSERELAKEHGITYQHTFVIVDQNGEQITKWNGGGLDEILENIN